MFLAVLQSAWWSGRYGEMQEQPELSEILQESLAVEAQQHGIEIKSAWSTRQTMNNINGTLIDYITCKCNFFFVPNCKTMVSALWQLTKGSNARKTIGQMVFQGTVCNNGYGQLRLDNLRKKHCIKVQFTSHNEKKATNCSVSLSST